MTDVHAFLRMYKRSVGFCKKLEFYLKHASQNDQPVRIPLSSLKKLKCTKKELNEFIAEYGSIIFSNEGLIDFQDVLLLYLLTTKPGDNHDR